MSEDYGPWYDTRDPMHTTYTPWRKIFLLWPRKGIWGHAYTRLCLNDMQYNNHWREYISRTQFAVLRLKGEA